MNTSLLSSTVSERVDNYIKIKDISHDLRKVLTYFTEVEKDYKNFDYNKAQCMSELLASTVNYLHAYVLAKESKF
jgi:hypothetical protein